MYKHTESYKHLFAKELMAHWLRSEEERSGDCCKLAQFEWRANYGVFVELPFYSTSDPYYWECSGGLAEDGENTWDPNYDMGQILFVPDIVVFHKGTPRYFFEIVHTSPVSPAKLKAIWDFFNDKGHSPPEVIEVNADYILRQTGIPKRIKSKVVLSGY